MLSTQHVQTSSHVHVASQIRGICRCQALHGELEKRTCCADGVDKDSHHQGDEAAAHYASNAINHDLKITCAAHNIKSSHSLQTTSHSKMVLANRSACSRMSDRFEDPARGDHLLSGSSEPSATRMKVSVKSLGVVSNLASFQAMTTLPNAARKAKIDRVP